jgi:chemotaxis protein methyltransferase CheR
MNPRPRRDAAHAARLEEARAKLRARHGLDVRDATALGDKLARAIEGEVTIDDEALDRLAGKLRIGTTRLHRDASQLEAIGLWLRDRVRANASGHVLSAGCSTGEEAFTLGAMVLAAAGTLGAQSWRVVGVDIDPKAIDQARVGALDPVAVAALPARLRRWFSASIDARPTRPARSAIRPSRTLEAMIEWREGDLLRVPLGHRFDLIVCRNVLVYFDAPTSELLLRRLSRHLADDGLLIVARAEASRARAAGLVVATDVDRDAPAIFRRP